MAIKVDRPGDHAGDGVVVYVAKSKAEVDQARDGFAEAGIPVDLPEAAIEAMFAAGRKNLPIRVTAADFRRAQDVIDALFPPPVMELPPLPGEAQAASGAEPQGPSGASARTGPHLDTYVPAPVHSAGASVKSLDKSGYKVIGICVMSFLVPVLGLLAAIFGLVSAVWILRHPRAQEAALKRAKVAIGFGVTSALWHVGILIAWATGNLPSLVG